MFHCVLIQSNVDEISRYKNLIQLIYFFDKVISHFKQIKWLTMEKTIRFVSSNKKRKN